MRSVHPAGLGNPGRSLTALNALESNLLAICMATRVGFQRRKDGPWVIVMVPMEDEDHLYPSRCRFYKRGGTTDNISRAHQFAVKIEGRKFMNRLMDQRRNMYAELIPFSIAWAILHASRVPWKTAVPKHVQIQYPRDPP